MRSRGFVAAIIIVLGSILTFGQTSPNLEIGFKPYGSYHGTPVDSVNLMNGGTTLHLPFPQDYVQRGGKLGKGEFLTMHSKSWAVQIVSDGTSAVQKWMPSRAAIGPVDTLHPVQARFVNITPDGPSGVTQETVGQDQLMSWDGSTHGLMDVSSGNQTAFEAIDGSGWHVNLNSPDQYGVPQGGVITDRDGTQYTIGKFSQRCSSAGSTNTSGSAGGRAPYQGTTPDSSNGTDCNENSLIVAATDANGNMFSMPLNSVWTDTLGRPAPLGFTATGGVNFSNPPAPGCPATAQTYYGYGLAPYAAANGGTNQILMCYGNLTLQSNFGVSGVQEFPGAVANPPITVITGIVLPDGSAWTFSYDAYGNLTEVGLPLGGTISYQWANVAFPMMISSTPMSRAVVQRTLTDNNGNSYVWKYQWVVAQSSSNSASGTITNVVTDPLGNDTVHVFTNLQGRGLYETRTQSYQGSYTAGTLLEDVSTGYQVYYLMDANEDGGLEVLPNSIQTTVYPSGKVKLVQKSYDAALTDPVSGTASYGKLLVEKDYDWGQGAPGALLRETDTTYEWQVNSAYFTAHMLDLPASVVVKDGSGNKLAETDYTYDESQYLTASNISTQHGAAPNAVRGNLTTVSRWLNTGGSPVISHTNWYDTGEVYQAINPLGNTTTHSYDAAYVGGYSTKTCNALNQCVSGTYDFNTGLLTSFTDANGSYAASGNTAGDPAHSSSYSYDFLGRMTQALLPPDPSGNHPQTSFQYPNPISLPFRVTRTHSVTSSLSDSQTSTYDGLGRIYKTQHPLPNGTAEVDTTYDGLDHVVSVTNPYFSTSDATYGVTQSQYDALGRATQVTKQDGSVSSAAYAVAPILPVNGDCTRTTDEAGKQRLTCSDGLGRLTEVHEPGTTFSGSQAQGSFSINAANGSGLQTYVIPGNNATNATGSVTINGGDQSITTSNRVCAQYDENGDCVDWEVDNSTTSDSGTVTVTVNGASYKYNYGSGDNAGTVATALQTTINNTSSYVQVTSVSANSSATPPTATLHLQARSSGTGGNDSLSAGTTYDSADFSSPSFSTSTSGMSGGNNGTSPTTVYDSGTVTVSIGSFQASAPYSQSGSSSAAQVAQALISSSNPNNLNRSGSPVTASVSGSTVTITYASVGTAGNITVGCSSTTGQAAYFSGASFTCPSTTALNGGYNPEGPSLDFNYFATQYQYDGLGNLRCVHQKATDTSADIACTGSTAPTVPASWHQRFFTYDSLSRLLTALNPESGQISYSYDADGNVVQKTSPAPNQTGAATQTISYCYDKLNRVTGKVYSAQSCPLSTPVVTYTYDAGTNGIGHLTSLTDQAGSGSYSYDPLGRITAEQRTIAGIQKNLSYAYNLDSSIATLTYPSGAAVTYTPDSAGRILSAIDSGNNINYVTNASYQADGSLTGFVSGASSGFGGITNQWQYNARLQVCRITALTAGTPPSSCTDAVHLGNVLDLGYNMNLGAGDNGNVAGITNYKDTSRSQTFTYDLLNRLISAQNAGTDCTQSTANSKTKYWGNSYSYDAWGNLLQKTTSKCGAENLSVTALANNQLSGYGYDSAGNMTHDATTGNNYTFDQENRITGAAGYTYTYDADGSRVEKSNGSTGTIYWYMSPGIVAESDLTGSLKSEYVFFDGERVARKDFPGDAVSYYFSDHLKTASVITSSAGTITEDEDYYPWGGEIWFVNSDSNHYKFTGKERDSETGLDYFGARYYSNWTGRFLTPDWAAKATAVPYANFGNPQSLNLYTYGKNNPTTFGDPDGHCDWCQKLWNDLKGNGWRTDQQVKDDAQSFRNSIGQGDVAGVYNPNTGQVTTYNRDQLNKMSDSQVVQLKDLIDSSAPTSEDQQNIAKALAQAISFAPSQLQAKFKHAEDFGVQGNYNKANGEAYEKALRDHMSDPNTQQISGTYRGQPAEIYYNSKTGNAVITDKAGNYISGWKLSTDQVQHVLTSGKLGGG